MRVSQEMEEDRDFTERVWAEVRKAGLLPPTFCFIVKMIILPRQALDTRRESTQTRLFPAQEVKLDEDYGACGNTSFLLSFDDNISSSLFYDLI
jgi:hypothetical protein